MKIEPLRVPNRSTTGAITENTGEYRNGSRPTGTNQPFDGEAERAVLGSLLIDGRIETAQRVFGRLSPRDFHDDGNRLIFTAMCDLAVDGKPVDVVLLALRLKSQNRFDRVGGASYIARLSNAVPSAAMVDHYADTVSKHAQSRRLIESLQRAIQDAQASPDDLTGIAASLRANLDQVVAANPDGEWERLLSAYGIDPPWTSAELATADIVTTYLVENVLVANQSCVIAGGSKGMKTTSGIDLALSLATARKFLGRFWIPDPKRVLFLSAESGAGTIQETALRIAKWKELDLATEANMRWGFWVPKARNAEMLKILGKQLDESRAEVCIIDPLYQVLAGEDQNNLSLNGQQITIVTDLCLSRGCTPVLIDHVKKSSENARSYQPLELNDVTGAGKAENFRQWLLLSRRERFEPDHPIHRLWMTVGGSAGHCGAYAIDIDESRDEDGSRTFAVEVSSASQAREHDRAEQERQRANAQAKKDAERIRLSVSKIRKALPVDEHWSKNQIKNATGLNTGQVSSAIAHLLDQGEIQTGRYKNETGPWFEGVKWTENATHLRSTK
ncbi:DnaB-like helicase N-terminal domain-containing protein [Stieleria magnilauensis]|uniref:Replicative DNA helicase n=1 Tax=Stieleria magnilauensis TaxID=2527963 RepID=A0ABX5Y2P3_9BACT|nr:Replicative DNA helicase [Planctomycetes bacterium TBK1r]